MNDILFTPLFAIFSIVLIVETIKTLVLAAATASSRLGPMQFLNQEDADWLGGEAVTVDHPTPARLMRAHRNNLENLAPFFIVGSLFVVSGANATFGIAYFVAFLLARLLHTYAYLSKRPKLRRNMFTIAWFAIIAAGLHSGFVILSKSFA